MNISDADESTLEVIQININNLTQFIEYKKKNMVECEDSLPNAELNIFSGFHNYLQHYETCLNLVTTCLNGSYERINEFILIETLNLIYGLFNIFECNIHELFILESKADKHTNIGQKIQVLYEKQNMKFIGFNKRRFKLIKNMRNSFMHKNMSIILTRNEYALFKKYFFSIGLSALDIEDLYKVSIKNNKIHFSTTFYNNQYLICFFIDTLIEVYLPLVENNRSNYSKYVIE